MARVVTDMDKTISTNTTNTTIEKDRQITEKSIRLTSGDSEIVLVSNDEKDSIIAMSNHAEKIFGRINKRADVDYIG